jgi:hypothetical protein
MTVVRSRCLTLCLVACLAATPAFAQDPESAGPQTMAVDQAKPDQQPPAQKPPAPARPRTPKPPFGLRGFLVVEGTAMAASSTFKAITGTSTLVGAGGGVELLNLFKKVFVRFGVSSASKDGERAFLIDGDVVSTGIPMTIAVRTVELSVGWRKELAKRPNPKAPSTQPPPKQPPTPRFALYFGAGVL